MDKQRVYTKMTSLYPFLETFSKPQKDMFIENMVVARHEAGKVVMGEGLGCKHVSFVLSGCIRIYCMTDEGREITLYRVRRGDLCMITVYCTMIEVEFPAIAQVEQASEVVALPAERFKELVSHAVELQHFVFASSLQRLQDVIQVVEAVKFTSVRQRLAMSLVRLTKQQANHTLKITHEKLASEIGSAREVVSRTLKELEREGVLRSSRGRIAVLSIESLENLCLCD